MSDTIDKQPEALREADARIDELRAENERLISALDSLSVPSFADARVPYIECQIGPEDYVALWRAAGRPLDALPEWLAAAQPEPEEPTT